MITERRHNKQMIGAFITGVAITYMITTKIKPVRDMVFEKAYKERLEKANR